MMIDDMTTQSSVLTNCRPHWTLHHNGEGEEPSPVPSQWSSCGVQPANGSGAPGHVTAHPSEMSTLGPGNVFTSAGADGNIVSVNKEGLPTPTNYQTAQQTTCSLPGPQLKYLQSGPKNIYSGQKKVLDLRKKYFLLCSKIFVCLKIFTVVFCFRLGAGGAECGHDAGAQLGQGEAGVPGQG